MSKTGPAGPVAAFLLALTASILAAAPAAAQDDEDGLLAVLLANASYQAEAAAAVFPRNYTRDARDVHDPLAEAWTRISASSDAELAEGVLFRLSAFAVISTVDEEYNGIFAQPENDRSYARHLDFSELSLTYEADDFEATIGKAPIAVGLSTLYSPANRYTTYEAVSPQHTQNLGAWRFGGTYYLEDDAASLYVLPFETRSPTPPVVSRWFGDSFDSAFFSGDLPDGSFVSERFRSPRLDDWGVLAVYNGVGEGLDYFLSAHYGPSVYPVLRVELPGLLIKENPTAVTLAAGFTTTVESWEFHGEAAYQDTHANRDQDFLKYVAGFAYRETDELAPLLGLEEIMPIFEWAREWVSTRQDASNYLIDSSLARPFVNSFIARVLLKRDDELSYLIAGTRNNREKDWGALLGVEFKPDDNLTLTASAAGFWGENSTQLGRWRRNNFLQVGFKRKF